MRSLWSKVLFGGLVLYTCVLLYATLRPFQFTTHPGRNKAHGRHSVEWVPFTRLCPVHGIFCPSDTGLNVAAFIPVGVLAALMLGTHGGGMRLTARAALFGFSLSLLIETAQYFIPSRFPSTTDLLMNTLGACLGGLIVSGLFHKKTSQLGHAGAPVRTQPD